MPLTRTVNLHKYGSSGSNTVNLDPYTYDDRYPWLDKYNYDKLSMKIDALGLSWYEREQAMDTAYTQILPIVQNDIKNSDMRKIINQSSYEVSQMPEWKDKKVSTMKLWAVQLAQTLKEKYKIDASMDDEYVLKTWIDTIPDWEQLLANYLNDGDKELLYVWGLESRPIQLWGTKNLINQASASDKAWDEKSTREKTEDVTNKVNAIWWGTEELDKQASKFAEKWLDWGNSLAEWAVNNLQNKLDNMSREEIEWYRKQYEQLLKDKDWKVGKVQGDTIVEQLWNGIKGNISYDYTDEDFMKWLISQKANLGESLTWADDLLKWESDPNVVQLFGNIPASAVKTFTATVRWMTNPYDTMKWIYLLGKDVADNGFENSVIWQRYGSWDAFAKAMNDDPVWVADDALAVLELGGNIVSWWLKATGKLTWNASLTNAWNWVAANNFWSANDALAWKTIWWVYGALDYIGDYSNSNLVKWGVRVLEDASNLSRIVKDGKEIYDRAKETTPIKWGRNFVDEIINKTVGVDKADREFIMNNKEIVDDYISWKKNVETVLDEVKNKIDEKQLANSEMGKEYDALREKWQTVSTEALASDMVDRLRKNKITINADGNLEFDKLSKFNEAQQKALQDAWQVIKDAQAAWNVDAGTILDLRQKFDDKVNWTWKPTELRNMSSVDKATESLIKEMRSTIDARAKDWIDGLKELDEKYAPALEEMRNIKRDWFDSNGNLKDNARSKLRNLTKAWNEEKLSRLEQLAPWITNDLKALDVAQTIDKVTKQSVGQYAKGAWIAWWGMALVTWNIPAALVSIWVWILATPKNFVKLIEAYPDIVEKLSAWAELLPSDMDRLQALATRLEDGMVE